MAEMPSFGQTFYLAHFGQNLSGPSDAAHFGRNAERAPFWSYTIIIMEPVNITVVHPPFPGTLHLHPALDMLGIVQKWRSFS